MVWLCLSMRTVHDFSSVLYIFFPVRSRYLIVYFSAILQDFEAVDSSLIDAVSLFLVVLSGSMGRWRHYLRPSPLLCFMDTFLHALHPSISVFFGRAYPASDQCVRFGLLYARGCLAI